MNITIKKAVWSGENILINDSILWETDKHTPTENQEFMYRLRMSCGG